MKIRVARAWFAGVRPEAWGVTITWRISQSGLSGGNGSVAKTSRPAPASRPERRAATRAASSTRSPRPTFTSRAPGGRQASRAAERMPRVSSVSGRASTSQSVRASSASRRERGQVSQGSSPRGRRVNPTVSIPKAIPRPATLRPMGPMPRTPSRWPCRSTTSWGSQARRLRASSQPRRSRESARR